MTFRKDSKNGMRIFLAMVIALSLLLLIFGVSCGTPASLTSPTPSPAPAPAPAPTIPPVQSPPQPSSTSKWAADGTISEGEYTGTKNYGDYEISWASDGKYVYIAMKAKTSGWIAMAVQPGSRMKDADIILGLVQDGEVIVYDSFSTGDYGPHPQDTELGGTNDVIEFGGREEAGSTIIEFKRALNTGDKYDKPLAKGLNKIIWSYGTGDSSTLKHINRGYGELEL